MRDTELYQRVLGLEEPWRVEQVKLDVAGKRVDIALSHAESLTWCWPHCQRQLSCYDHVAERTWRHLDTCQFQTHLRARLPRVKCPEHGVMQRAVERGRQRKREQTTEQPVRYVGVDEKAFRKGHSYITVVCDLERSTVEHVADDREAESLGEYFQSLSDEQRQAIDAVAMDMWQPYIKATHEHLPWPGAEEKIVFDRFHILKLMNEAVDAVRKQEHRRLQAAGDDRLKGTKYLWLYAKENLPDRHQPTFNTLREQNLRTSRAWAIKQTLRSLWDYRSATWARKFFAKWFGWARRSRLAPIKKVALIFQRHLPNILTYCRHPITNGVAEGLNSRIMTIKRKACGYRNRENFKTAIYFFCGGLNLYPQ